MFRYTTSCRAVRGLCSVQSLVPAMLELPEYRSTDSESFRRG